jgi:hypothetical protein
LPLDPLGNFRHRFQKPACDEDFWMFHNLTGDDSS